MTHNVVKERVLLTLALFPVQVIWTELSRELKFRGYVKETVPVASSGGCCRGNGTCPLNSWEESKNWGNTFFCDSELQVNY